MGSKLQTYWHATVDLGALPAKETLVDDRLRIDVAAPLPEDCLLCVHVFNPFLLGDLRRAVENNRVPSLPNVLERKRISTLFAAVLTQ